MASLKLTAIIACKEKGFSDGIYNAIYNYTGLNGAHVVTCINTFHEIARNYANLLIVLDERLNGIKCRDSIFELIQQYPQARFIVLTSSTDPPFLLKILKAVAAAIPKDTLQGLEEITLCIRNCLRYGKYVCHSLIEKTNTYLNKLNTKSDILTATQMKVLVLQVKNYSVEETAAEIEISIGTVNIHRYNIKTRTKEAGFPSYIDYARHIGLLDN